MILASHHQPIVRAAAPGGAIPRAMSRSMSPDAGSSAAGLSPVVGSGSSDEKRGGAPSLSTCLPLPLAHPPATLERAVDRGCEKGAVALPQGLDAAPSLWARAAAGPSWTPLGQPGAHHRGIFTKIRCEIPNEAARRRAIGTALTLFDVFAVLALVAVVARRFWS